MAAPAISAEATALGLSEAEVRQRLAAQPRPARKQSEAGTHDTSLQLRTSDLLRLTDARVLDLCQS